MLSEHYVKASKNLSAAKASFGELLADFSSEIYVVVVLAAIVIILNAII